ncbi:glucose/quinate/shikimate family membrane-bound PQQ-dependent dehydrogenase [Aquincola sp. MAHUQ-54]|uniref:Glucose/quinate/shikimate family membrane-bound PQQ-dependent dehydrogenase n=1 Tax=Aquincola agrisoli TaxID=3119538 RepID=A0AAW9Q9K9_9BURK
MPRGAVAANDPRRPPLVTAGLVMVAGLLLLGAGGWLVALGGSGYYAAAGVALMATAWLLWRGRSSALLLYAGFTAATLAWALWEVGLDWWPLAARGDLVFLLGLWLLSPWVARRLGPARPAPADAPRSPAAWRGPRGLLGGVLLVFAAVAIVSGAVDRHRTEGTLPPPAAAGGAAASTVPDGEWHAYGRTGEGQRYSPLSQITPANAGELEAAWHFRTGDVRGRPGDPEETTFEVTPLKVGNRLFLCTPHQLVIALDATSGRQLWRFDPQIKGEGTLALQHLTCRGLAYQPPPSAGAADATPCRSKLFMPTADARLVALDPATGTRCQGFGVNGEIDLWTQMPNVQPGSYYATSPVVVTERLVIVGGTVLDNVSTKETSGVIRAFDIATGALVWNWDAARPDDTAPLPQGRTYTPNSPNSWSISSVDPALGLVYVPMGNQPPDQWGADRSPAVERYASAVVALELATGRVRWAFQTVHHDLWDYDVPAQPSLVDLTIGGRRVPALVQPTKQGEVFVLDRRTGEPLLPVQERPAPQGAVAGDRTAPTQPVSAISFDPPPLRERDMWGATMFDQLACRIAFRQLRYEGRYTPPSLEGTLVYPGNFGVFNWGGVAVDPVRQMMFATPTYLAFTSQLVPRPDDKTLLVQGDERPHDNLPSLNENFGAPFAVKLGAFTSPLGIPCQAPPWGYVAGVDLTTGKVVWQHKNGTVRDSSPLPLPFAMGVPNLGGPVMTAGGVAFLSGTLDQYVRAYDTATGRQVWQGRLPAGGQATPMTYLGDDGRQYVVVVAGGHGSLGTRAGDHVIAYALPRR